MNVEQASSEYQPKGDWDGRAAHVTAKATDRLLRIRSGAWTSPGYWRQPVVKEWCGTRETLPGEPDVGRKTARIRERPKSRGAGRESEELIVPEKPVKAERREGALRW